MKNRIALIILRFGSSPAFFDLWAKSAVCNEEIDFLIFTNCKNDFQRYYNKYKNLKFFYITQAEVERRIEEKTGFDYKFVSGYKLCDFKPSLGLLFEDYIEKYDFWGYCDTDLFFGDISSFISDDLLNSCDRLFSLGHLSIYRNNDLMKKIFLTNNSSQISFANVCSTDKVLGFDELSGMHQICLNKGIRYLYPHEDIFDIDIFHYNMHKGIELKIEKSPLAFYWSFGHLYAVTKDGRKKEILYAHFQKRKMRLFVDESKQNVGFFCNKCISCDSIAELLFEWKKNRNVFISASYYLKNKLLFNLNRIKRRVSIK